MTQPTASPLSVDLYQLTMGQAYYDAGLAERPATFSLFFRSLPAGWGYLLAAGLDAALCYLEELAFGDEDIAFLESLGLFTGPFLGHLRELRFNGDVRAMPEGTLVFPQEPLLEVTGPIVEAQIAETMLINIVHFRSLVAGKAARSADVAGGRALVDFGMRRAHGEEAGLEASRASYLAGFDSTSNVLAGREYGIPVAGTMAHSFVQSFDDELEAFRAYARSYPDTAILLVDTYDTIEGTRKAIQVAEELAARGSRLRGVRIDSGDLLDLSRRVRDLLDEAGLEDTIVFASGGLDEYEIDDLLAAGAPIGGFGVGTKMVVSADAPFVDMAYKLVELDGRPTFKLSTGKATLPGAKQVWRVSNSGRFEYDVIERAAAPAPNGAKSLLSDVMRGGRPLVIEPLERARERAADERGRLPERHRRLNAEPYEVRVGPALAAYRDELVSNAVRGPA